MRFLVGWLSCLWLVPAVGIEPAAPSLAVAVRLAPGPYIVGQTIRLDVIRTDPASGEAAGGGPQVEAPRVAQAELVAVPLDRSVPGGVDPALLARFHLVPRRAGRWSVPPFRVRSGDQAGATRPVPINVANVPATGRTPAFLGGVGSFEVASVVEPSVVRVGSPVEVRITITGPAALGSNQSPDLAAWSKLAAAFQIRVTANSIAETNPPARTWRYRLRPMQPGRAVLPPVPLAAFDPESQHFATRYTPSMSLLVEPQPRFDPAEINLGSARTQSVGDLVGLAIVLGVGPLLVGLGVAINRRALRRHRGHQPVDWRREARELARWTSQEWRGNDAAERIIERLGRGFERSTGQSVAVLTPFEADQAVQAITRNGELAARVRQLVAQCDWLRFDPAADADATVGDLEELVAEAVAVFQAIGQSIRTNQPNRFRRRR